MTATVDQSGCISCGLCASLCPNVFRIGVEGLSEAYVSPVPKDQEALVISAQESCPVSVIHVSK